MDEVRLRIRKVPLADPNGRPGYQRESSGHCYLKLNSMLRIAPYHTAQYNGFIHCGWMV